MQATADLAQLHVQPFLLFQPAVQRLDSQSSFRGLSRRIADEVTQLHQLMREGAVTESPTLACVQASASQRMLVDEQVGLAASFDQVECLGREESLARPGGHWIPQLLRYVQLGRFELDIEQSRQPGPYAVSELQGPDEAQRVETLDGVCRDRLDI